MAALCGQDREIIAIWREHGIPLDRTTVDTAAEIIGKLDTDLAEAWTLIDQLTRALSAKCPDTTEYVGTVMGPHKVTP